MKKYLKENGQFLLLMASWIAGGFISQELATALVFLTIVLLKFKNHYAELIISFCFLLLLSDNRHDEYEFAAKSKDIALITLAAFALFDRKQLRWQNSFFYPFTFFLILGLVMSYRHPDPFFSFQKAVSYTLMFAVIPNYFSKLLVEQGEVFLRKFILFFAIALAFGLSMIFWNNEDAYLVGRFNGILGNPNGVGTYCTVLTILTAAALFYYPNLLTRGQLFFVIGVIAVSVLFAQSRNAIFSILLFLFFRRFYRISYYYGFVIVIAASLAFQVISQMLPEIIMNLGLGEYFRIEHLDDGSGRLIAWAFSWDEIQRNLLFGRGFAYDEHYFTMHEEMLSNLGHQGGVHNTYLSIWMNTGITGLVLFLYGLLRSFFKASVNCYLALPALFAIMFSINFESWLMGSLNPFTIVAILTVSLMQFKLVTDAKQEKSSIPVL